MDKEQLDLWDRLNGEYQGLADRVMIDRGALSAEVLEHSEAHRRASENWVYGKRVLAYAIRDKATCWAETCNRVREAQTVAFNTTQGHKVTDKSVENSARIDVEYRKSAVQLSDCEMMVGLYEELSKRFHGRGFRLRDLVTLHAAGRDRDYLKDEPRTYYGSDSRESENESRGESDDDPPASDDDVPTRRRRFGAIK